MLVLRTGNSCRSQMAHDDLHHFADRLRPERHLLLKHLPT